MWGCCAGLCPLVCVFADSHDEDPSRDVLARAKGEAGRRDEATRDGL